MWHVIFSTQLSLLVVLSIEAATVRPQSCIAENFPGKKLRPAFPREYVSTAHFFYVDEKSYMSKYVRQGIRSEALANALNEVLDLNIRPPGASEFASPVHITGLIRGGKYQRLDMSKKMELVRAHMSPACSSDDLCSEHQHHRVIIMQQIPHLSFDFFANSTKYPLLNEDRGTHFVQRVAHIFLLDSVLSFKDNRQTINCFADTQSGVFWGVDYDSCEQFGHYNSTHELKPQVMRCAQDKMPAYAGNNLQCEVFNTAAIKIENGVINNPDFSNLLLTRLRNPFWSTCPFPLPGFTGDKLQCITTMKHSLDYFEHPDFPWSAIDLSTNSFHSARHARLQCKVDEPQLLTFILTQRLLSVYKQIKEALSKECSVVL